MVKMDRIGYLLFLLACVLMLTTCGGGGRDGGTSPTPPPDNITGNAILDIQVVDGGPVGGGGVPPPAPDGYTLLNVDLNSGTGGHYIWLYYKVGKADGSEGQPISKIYTVDEAPADSLRWRRGDSPGGHAAAGQPEPRITYGSQTFMAILHEIGLAGRPMHRGRCPKGGWKQSCKDVCPARSSRSISGRVGRGVRAR